MYEISKITPGNRLIGWWNHSEAVVLGTGRPKRYRYRYRYCLKKSRYWAVYTGRYWYRSELWPFHYISGTYVFYIFIKQHIMHVNTSFSCYMVKLTYKVEFGNNFEMVIILTSGRHFKNSKNVLFCRLSSSSSFR